MEMETNMWWHVHTTGKIQNPTLILSLSSKHALAIRQSIKIVSVRRTIWFVYLSVVVADENVQKNRID